MAADLPVAPPAAPAYNPAYHPALYNWTGFYIGGQIGAGILDDTVTNTTTTIFQNAGTSARLTPFALIGGPVAGFDIEFHPIVVGVQATWTSSAISGSTTIASAETSPAASDRPTSNPQWYATVTGRIGYAADDLLFYVKGGGAWMHAAYTQDVLDDTGAVVSTQSLGDTRTGFVVGGGLEYGLTEWISLVAEYDFLDFGTKDYTFSNVLTPGGTVDSLPVAIQSHTHMVTLGLNFRFNGFGGGSFAK